VNQKGPHENTLKRKRGKLSRMFPRETGVKGGKRNPGWFPRELKETGEKGTEGSEQNEKSKRELQKGNRGPPTAKVSHTKGEKIGLARGPSERSAYAVQKE